MVLGRSGTGKTTTALMKIFLLQKLYTEAKKKKKVTLEELNLCFCTFSKQLVDKVYEYYHQVSGDSYQLFNPEDSFNDIKVIHSILYIF